MPQIPAPQQQVAVPQLASAALAEAITLSDTTTYENVRFVWVGGLGDLTVTMSGVDVTFAAVPAGSLLPIAPTVFKESTTATSVVALF